MWHKTLLTIFLMGSAGTAAAEDRLQGPFPDTKQTIDVDMKGTVAEALQAIATKAGWSLVVSAPTLDQRISLKTAKRPLLETLVLVLEAGDLRARLEGTTLVVKSYKKANADDDNDDEEDEAVDAPDPPDPPEPPDPPDHGERTAYGQDLTIKKGEVVDDAVVQGGDLIVEGRVRGDAAAMGGDIIVKSGGIIDGDAAAMGGDVEVEKGGVIKGSISKVGGGAFSKVFKGLATRAGMPHVVPRPHHDNDDDDDSSFGALFVMSIFASIAAFVLSVILIAFVPERIERITAMLEQKPMQSAAGGIVTLVGFLPFCLLLAVSIVGIALLPMAFFALVFVYTAGYTAFAVWLGRRIPLFVGRKTMLGAMGVGLGAMTLLAIVPVLGTFLCFFIATFGAGAVMISRFGTPPKISETAT